MLYFFEFVCRLLAKGTYLWWSIALMGVAANCADPFFGLLFFQWYEHLFAVLAQGAEIVVRYFIALIYIAADGADIALFLSCLGLGFDVALIVGVCAGGSRSEDLSVSKFSDKQQVTAEVISIHYFAGQVCVRGSSEI